MRDKIISFGIETFDLIVYLILWASLWSVYDYMITKYIGDYHEYKTLKFNIAVFILGIIALLVRNIVIYKYSPV